MVWDLDGFDYPTEVMLLPYSECGTALERVVRPLEQVLVPAGPSSCPPEPLGVAHIPVNGPFRVCGFQKFLRVPGRVPRFP
jgi:hypothetical protein